MKQKLQIHLSKAALMPRKQLLGDVPAVKPHKRRRRDSVRRVIRRYQNSNEPLIPRLPFQRAVRHATQKYDIDMRFQKSAIQCIQDAVEGDILKTLIAANGHVVSTGQVTLRPKSIQVALAMKEIME